MTKCPICGESDRVEHVQTTNNPIFSLYECTGCGFYFIAASPPTDPPAPKFNQGDRVAMYGGGNLSIVVEAIEYNQRLKVWVYRLATIVNNREWHAAESVLDLLTAERRGY
jgi:rubredoxin